MIHPIKNATTEAHAQAIAATIKANDRGAYDQAMAEAKGIMDRMVRWELIAFRERVHYLAKH